jgi:hypothetical protein
MTKLSQLRAYIVARLVAEGIAGANVNNSHYLPLEDDALPAVNVYALSGSGERRAQNAPMYDADVRITIDAFAAGTSERDTCDRLDALTDDILTCLMGDPDLATRLHITRYEFSSTPSVEGAEYTGGVQITLTGKYDQEWDYSYPNNLETIGMTVRHRDHVVAMVEIEREPED